MHDILTNFLNIFEFFPWVQKEIFVLEKGVIETIEGLFWNLLMANKTWKFHVDNKFEKSGDLEKGLIVENMKNIVTLFVKVFEFYASSFE